VASGDELRRVMRRFAAPIAVLTVDRDGDRLGLTVGSLVSLSLEPALVGVSVGKDQAALELIRGAGTFAASLLSAEQEAVARRFALGAPPIALWQGVALRPGTVAPLVEGAVGWLECRLWSECDAGDHTVLVGEVLAAEPGVSGRGLVYREGSYHPA
jgi:flavin reductase (DIM6/NTAB) family NADH-FMN oxidoreductase RutF